MRRFLSSMAAGTLVAGLGLATAAGAAVVAWEGTLVVNLGTLPQFIHYGTGVATVNGSGGMPMGHIDTISIASGLSFTGGNNVPEVIPLTDPDNPTFMTLRATGMRVGKVTAPGLNFVTAVWNGISGGPPLGTMNTGRLPGRMKYCILFPGCQNYLPIPFGLPVNPTAVGVGGLITVNTFSKDGGFKLSVQGAPWTIGLASIKNVTTETPNGWYITYTKTLQGFAHGPFWPPSTPLVSGVLQMVTPVFVGTNLGAPDTYQAMWAEVRLHYIPEPGLLLLLGAGVGGLLLLGRSRMRGS